MGSHGLFRARGWGFTPPAGSFLSLIIADGGELLRQVIHQGTHGRYQSAPGWEYRTGNCTKPIPAMAAWIKVFKSVVTNLGV